MSTLIMLPLDNNKVLQQHQEAAAAAAADHRHQEGRRSSTSSHSSHSSHSSLFRRRGSTSSCHQATKKKGKKDFLASNNRNNNNNNQDKQLTNSSNHTVGTAEGFGSSLTFSTISTEFLHNNNSAAMEAMEKMEAAATTANGGSSDHEQHDYCNGDNSISSMEGDAIYYFGYGTIVNPIVRLRRGCTVPRENIQTAILYDHRLEFIKGGTANIIPCRGWDVKGVLIKFTNAEEFHALHGYDLNYDIRDVFVSPISKTNIDPKKKNIYTAPFQQVDENGLEDVQEQQNENDQEQVSSRDNSSGGMSCPILGYNDDESDDDDEYSCPFAMSAVGDAARSAKMLGGGNRETDDPNAIRAVTFMFSPEDEDGGSGSSSSSLRHTRRVSNASSARSNSVSSLNDDTQCVVGMPQERYLKLIADGLRAHEIDEGYINDEILVVPFIKKERDGKYHTFPLVNSIKDANKIPKIPFSKYETKCFSPGSSQRNGSMLSSVRSNKKEQQQQQDLYFIVGRKVMKLIQDTNNDDNNGSNESATTQTQILNPVTRWIKEACHGRYDITLLVHQTFVDPECLLPLVDIEEDISPEHQAWAEHKIFLYLQRGGLSAVQVYELNTNEKGGRRPSLVDIGKRQRHSMPALSKHRFSLSMSAMSIGSIGSRRSSNHSHDSSDGSDDLLGGRSKLRQSVDLPLPTSSSNRRKRLTARSVSEGMTKSKFSASHSSRTFASRASTGTEESPTNTSNTTSSSMKKKFAFKGFKRSSH
jgi:hypothetical protein